MPKHPKRPPDPNLDALRMEFGERLGTIEAKMVLSQFFGRDEQV